MGIDDESSHPAIMCSEVAGGVTRKIVCLFREPDAGNLPVRFDEREQETELSPTGLRRRRESFVNGHRETKATAPVLDSTRHYTHRPVPDNVHLESLGHFVMAAKLEHLCVSTLQRGSRTIISLC